MIVNSECYVRDLLFSRALLESCRQTLGERPDCRGWVVSASLDCAEV